MYYSDKSQLTKNINFACKINIVESGYKTNKKVNVLLFKYNINKLNSGRNLMLYWVCFFKIQPQTILNYCKQ